MYLVARLLYTKNDRRVKKETGKIQIDAYCLIICGELKPGQRIRLPDEISDSKLIRYLLGLYAWWEYIKEYNILIFRNAVGNDTENIFQY